MREFMLAMTDWNHLCHSLGITLLHVLWQGLVVSAVLLVAGTLLQKAKTNHRYLLLCAGLFALPLLALVTFCVVLQLSLIHI